MGFARPYIDRTRYNDWDRERLITELVEAKVQLMEAQIAHDQRPQEPWYGSGQPYPYTPADGQW